MSAYEAYVGGIGYLLKFDYRSADRAFRKALELAPEFHMARYRLAQVQVVSGDTEGALATLDRIPKDAPLSRRERFYVDGAHALFARDAGRAKAIYNEMLRQFPFDVEARMLLAIAHDLAIEDEAAVGELKRLLVQEPQNDHLWSYLGETYLRLGEYELAREAMDRYLTLKPRDPFGFTILGQLEQLTGNPVAAVAHYTHALELEPGFVPRALCAGPGASATGRLGRCRAPVPRPHRGWRRTSGQQDRRCLRPERGLAGGRPLLRRNRAARDRSSRRFARNPFAKRWPWPSEGSPRLSSAGSRRLTSSSHAPSSSNERRDLRRATCLPAARMSWIRGDVAGVKEAATEIRGQRIPEGDPEDAT